MRSKRGRLDIAKTTLKTAEAKGMRDWKTLSAQGTLLAKQGNHAEAQQYYLAALQEKPDAVSVINNLALSYALDGKAKKSEQLLRKAVASGHEDKRVRQNLALVLGLQGKFDEARQVAAVDLTADQARSSMTFLRNMVSSPSQVASRDAPDDDWSPFADNSAAKSAAPVKAAAAPAQPMAQVVAPKQELKPSVAPTPVQTAGQNSSTKTKTDFGCRGQEAGNQGIRRRWHDGLADGRYASGRCVKARQIWLARGPVRQIQLAPSHRKRAATPAVA